MKNRRFLLLFISFFIVCTVVSVLFINYYNKTNSNIDELSNNIIMLKEELGIERAKNEDLLKE